MDRSSIFRGTEDGFGSSRSSATIIIIIVAIVILIALAVAAYFLIFRNRTTGTACTTTADCATGQICQNQVCTVITGGGNQCVIDQDCPSGQACNNGNCVVNSQCVVDGDCTAGFFCDNGTCQPLGGCTIDADCPVGQICDNGTCIPAGGGAPTPPTGISLSSPATGTLVVDWNPVATATSYKVYLGLTPAFTRGAALQAPVTSNTTLQFSGLTTPFTYYVFVTASNGSGESANSVESNLFLNFIWPATFVINNRDPPGNPLNGSMGNQGFPPAAGARFNSNDTTCRAPFCPCGTHCIYTYDQNTLEIKNNNMPNLCVVTTAQSDGAFIELQPCASTPAARKQWLHDPSGPKICLQSNSTLCMGGSGVFPTRHVGDAELSTFNGDFWQLYQPESATF